MGTENEAQGRRHMRGYPIRAWAAEVMDAHALSICTARTPASALSAITQPTQHNACAGGVSDGGVETTDAWAPRLELHPIGPDEMSGWRLANGPRA